MREIVTSSLPDRLALQAAVSEAIASRGAAPVDVEAMAVEELLVLHRRVAAALARRDVMNPADPTAGLARHHLCEAFGWRLAPATAPHSAETTAGDRVLVRGRRLPRLVPGETFGKLPDGGERAFDLFAGVVFGEDYEVLAAVLLPARTALARASRRVGGELRLTVEAATCPGGGARDVTETLNARLRLTARALAEADGPLPYECIVAGAPADGTARAAAG